MNKCLRRLIDEDQKELDLYLTSKVTGAWRDLGNTTTRNRTLLL